ncbi:MAG: UDP-2,4-diacetamido-2,4,6-trideoxy-beta-L-altropyranose hydrolase [Desulfobacterales bacterium]|nr:UDP-2,4-diacetamido-2,4,6-trideoxy-beta-L-altropyranose hydrolase [Desulfobacterales bacterium]
MQHIGNIYFRTDASVRIGSGHMMRCLTFAGEVQKKGWETYFVSRELPGNMFTEIKKRGHHLLPLTPVEYKTGEIDHNDYESNLGVTVKKDAAETVNAIKKSNNGPSWMVVDHYSLNLEWEKCIGKEVDKVFVIDDIADKYHQCDIILNQNYIPGIETVYRRYTEPSTKLLLGPKYAILRNEFLKALKKKKPGDGSISNILVYYGNVDPTNETEKALDAITTILHSGLHVNVVAGSSNPYKKQLKKKISKFQNVELHIQLEHLADLMCEADIALGAGGTTTWERMFMMLPAIVTTIADNQLPSITSVSKGNGIIYIGKSENTDSRGISKTLNCLINDREWMKTLIKETKNMNVGNKFENMVKGFKI